ncbi:MAG: hypothetical protein FWB88_06925 [Defluviitaleaceae bacterium]|nr:hypothetical protein [Defluviitaleaceae bacterium]MCL2239389.1 hypothetical protein [Defluviitaleaceae bacterium]
MGVAVLQADKLNLPEMFATKLRGKKVEIIESGESIIINPVQCPIKAMRGMLKSDGHEVDRFLTRMREDKELEYDN